MFDIIYTDFRFVIRARWANYYNGLEYKKNIVTICSYNFDVVLFELLSHVILDNGSTSYTQR